MIHDGRQLDWDFDPREALRRYPADRRPLLLHSGRYHAQWARYSLLAEADAAYRFDAHGSGTGTSRWLGNPAGQPADRWRHRPFRDLRRVLRNRAPLWLGYLAYDVGRFIERLPAHAVDDRRWPTIQLHRCPGWLVYDGLERTWRACGAWRDGDAPGLPPLEALPPRDHDFEADDPADNMTRAQFESAVARVLEYLAAGDAFEVNIAHRFTGRFGGDPRGLFDALCEQSPAWYGAYLELMPDAAEPVRRAIASTSPELFLDLDASGRVLTRPIKGTRPADVPADVLRDSEKDQAELNMVVDMLRNDLGRVCDYGTVRVVEPRSIESHPTVHHGVATIEGRLYYGKDVIDLLRAAMPGGSVTGAPKVRAMQIIDELEPVRRGPYCGAIGYVLGEAAQFNVAIRTMLVETGPTGTGTVEFSVGGGIVIDSTPADEHRETLDKAAAMTAALRRSGIAGVRHAS